MTVMTPETDRSLRSDAIRNQAVVFEVAREVFARDGLKASYNDIARRAGVGVGTVYRRYPDRDELILALFESRVSELVEFGAWAGRHADAWDGLRSFVEQVVALQVNDRGFTEFLAEGSQHGDRVARCSEQLMPVLDGLLARAQEQQRVRPELSGTDLAALMILVHRASTPEQPGLWRRYLALLLDGVVADGRAMLPGEPATTTALASMARRS